MIGSQAPWLEAVILELGAKKITTLEYALIETDHPQLKPILPEQFRQMYLEDPEPKFDALVTVSSLEHGGLGRWVQL